MQAHHRIGAGATTFASADDTVFVQQGVCFGSSLGALMTYRYDERNRLWQCSQAVLAAMRCMVRQASSAQSATQHDYDYLRL
jgi:hypothetical protein